MSRVLHGFPTASPKSGPSGAAVPGADGRPDASSSGPTSPCGPASAPQASLHSAWQPRRRLHTLGLPAPPRPRWPAREQLRALPSRQPPWQQQPPRPHAVNDRDVLNPRHLLQARGEARGNDAPDPAPQPDSGGGATAAGARTGAGGGGSGSSSSWVHFTQPWVPRCSAGLPQCVPGRRHPPPLPTTVLPAELDVYGFSLQTIY